MTGPDYSPVEAIADIRERVAVVEERQRAEMEQRRADSAVLREVLAEVRRTNGRMNRAEDRLDSIETMHADEREAAREAKDSGRRWRETWLAPTTVGLIVLAATVVLRILGV